MSRIAAIDPTVATGAVHDLFEGVRKGLGGVPNLFRVTAQSPAALEGMVSLYGAIGKTLDAKTREAIALATAEANGCDYCLSAHTYLGRHVAKLDDAEMIANRVGKSNDSKADAAVGAPDAIADGAWYAQRLKSIRAQMPRSLADAVGKQDGRLANKTDAFDLIEDCR